MSFPLNAVEAPIRKSGIIPTLMRIRTGVQVAGLSDVGCQRENNEDSYAYWEPSGDDQFQRIGRLAIVADGMGGHEGGQEASRIAVEAIQQMYAADPNGDPQTLLTAGFREAHNRIFEHSSKDEQLHGMGTTATALAIIGERLAYAHVGDSRLYCVRGQSINRLTRDHSYVNRLVEDGVLTPEEAEVHPQRNILTAALGVGPEITPDAPAQSVRVQSGDILVLCTDGLWGLVTDDEIRDTVVKNKPQVACETLVKMAKQRGGPDNITVQVLRVE